MARSLKRFYSIAEVARLVGETVSTIKFWEKEFPHLRPQTTPGGTRQFRESNIQDLRVLQRLLREEKLTLDGAREALRKRRNSLTLREDTLHRLEHCLAQLKTLREALS